MKKPKRRSKRPINKGSASWLRIARKAATFTLKQELIELIKSIFDWLP